MAALRRGARLVVVDPRRAGLAGQAHHWLRVRPSTDAALALAIAHVMIEQGWFDADFVRRWTNAPLLVRADTGRLLRAGDLSVGGDAACYVAWDTVADAAVAYDPARGRHAVDESRLALFGAREVASMSGPVACRPAFDLVAEQPVPGPWAGQLRCEPRDGPRRFQARVDAPVSTLPRRRASDRSTLSLPKPSPPPSCEPCHWSAQVPADDRLCW